MMRARLTRADFSALGKPRVRLAGPLLSLEVHAAPARAASAACVVSRKVSASAVRRNAIKRRCREAARAAGPRGTALVFRAKRAAGTASLPEVAREARALVEKLAR